MTRLKSLTSFPPYGFRYINPVFGMKKDDEGSFSTICQKEFARRKANKYLCEKHNLGLDMNSVEYDVEQQNVARCLAHGWNDFVVTDAPVTRYVADGSKKNRFGNAVVGARRVAAGVGVLLEWLGNSAKPVDQATAEHRANVCVTCPQNGKGGLLEYFTGKAADTIKKQIEIKNDLALKTSHDAELGTCLACLCKLDLKCHVPLKHILVHTSDEVKAKLDPRCWVLLEKL